MATAAGPSPPSPATKSVRLTMPIDYLALSDADLLRQCDVDTFRASGPGGQKRNKTDSAVRLRHRATGLVGQAVESRSQHENRARALRRLRERIALGLRRPVELDGYTPPDALRDLFPQGKRQATGRRDARYLVGIQALLDLFVAGGCALAETAQRIGVSTGVLSRFVLADERVRRTVNALRRERGLRPLR